MKANEHREIRKVTMNLPADLLQRSMEMSGVGATETVREALKEYNHAQACKALLSLRGKITHFRPYSEIKADRE